MQDNKLQKKAQQKGQAAAAGENPAGSSLASGSTMAPSEASQDAAHGEEFTAEAAAAAAVPADSASSKSGNPASPADAEESSSAAAPEAGAELPSGHAPVAAAKAASSEAVAEERSDENTLSGNTPVAIPGMLDALEGLLATFPVVAERMRMGWIPRSTGRGVGAAAAAADVIVIRKSPAAEGESSAAAIAAAWGSTFGPPPATADAPEPEFEPAAVAPEAEEDSTADGPAAAGSSGGSPGAAPDLSVSEADVDAGGSWETARGRNGPVRGAWPARQGPGVGSIAPGPSPEPQDGGEFIPQTPPPTGEGAFNALLEALPNSDWGDDTDMLSGFEQREIDEALRLSLQPDNGPPLDGEGSFGGGSSPWEGPDRGWFDPAPMGPWESPNENAQDPGQVWV